MGVSKFVYGGETKFDLTGDNVTPDSLVVGHTAHGADGEPVQGANPYELEATNTEVGSQTSLIAQIAQALEGKAAGGGSVEDLNAVLTEQEDLIAELQETLSHKMADRESDLPNGYYYVDFIEFNGKQLVDTGLIGNQDTRIRTSFTWGSSTQNHVYGCASPNNTASITSYMNGSWRFGSKYVTKSVTKNINTLPYWAYVDKTTIGITGSITSISDVEDFETINTLLVGGARSSDGGLPGSGLIGRIFFFYVWDGDTNVMKLVPVSDGTKYRFWDEVSKVFFDSMTDTPLEGGDL